MTLTIRQGLRMAVTVQVASVSLGVVGALCMASVITVLGGTEGVTEAPADGGSVAYGPTVAATFIFVFPVLLAPLALHGTGFAAALPQGPRAARFIAAAALTWLAMGATGLANPWVRRLLGQEQFSGLGVADHDMVFLAINAGIGEEAAYLAVPTGLVWMVGSILSARRSRRGATGASPERLWTIAAVIGPAAVLAGRATGHLYQGSVSALGGIVWGVALAAVFYWARSIWPLMLGHVLYDLPTSYTTWSGLIAHHIMTPAVIACVALLLARRCTPPRTTDYAARP